MEQFSIGLLSFGAAVAFPLLYLAVLQVRRLGAWLKKEKGPNERVGVIVVIFVVLGFGIGSFVQPMWDKGVSCRESNKPVVSCLLFQA